MSQIAAGVRGIWFCSINSSKQALNVMSNNVGMVEFECYKTGFWALMGRRKCHLREASPAQEISNIQAVSLKI